MPELATKATQLFAELETLRSKQKIDAFTSKRLEHEAKKLLSVDAFSGYQILGALSSFSGKIAEMRENYNKALQLALTPAQKSIVLHNHSIVLKDAGYLTEAVELSSQSYDLEAAELKLSNFVETCYRAGLFHRAIQYMSRVVLPKEIDFSQTIPLIVSFMDKHGVQDEELQKMIEIAVSVLHEHRFFDFRSIYIGLVSDGDFTWFQYVISVDCSVEEMVAMDCELATRLAEAELPKNLLSNFLVTYKFAEDDDETY
jgi:hypothetical protein